MPDRHSRTRRSVLAAVGGTLFAAGTAAARPAAGQVRRPRVTAVENGIAILHEGCDRARIYGDDRDAYEVQLSFLWDDDGVPGTGRYVLSDPDFPMTVDAADTPYGEVPYGEAPYGGDGSTMTVTVVDEELRELASASAPEGCNPL